MSAALAMRTESHQLWWKDTNGKHYPAGVAFYEPEWGEYRLKLHIHPELQLYLRPMSTENDIIRYRVESVLKKAGKFHSRRTVGDGICYSDKNKDVVMNFYPYSRELVMARSTNN